MHIALSLSLSLSIYIYIYMYEGEVGHQAHGQEPEGEREA